MTLVKICGVTTLEDALVAVEAGADMLGFNFYEGSSRCIQSEQVREICLELPEAITKVGVFVNAAEDFVRKLSQYLDLDYLQFHGNETPYYCEQFTTPYWKAFRLQGEKTLALMKKFEPYAYLIDAYQPGEWGGTGRVADWALAAQANPLGRIVLAGGITPENVGAAIAAVKPWCIDVCSGIEVSPGQKDQRAMRELIDKVQSQ